MTSLTVENASNKNSSAASSVTADQLFCSPNNDPKLMRSKRKSPPTVASFPISCLKCMETNDHFLRADFEQKTVTCKKCNHIGKAEDYDTADFLRACLYDSKQGSSSGYKKHAETAYLTCLADCKRADNEKEMILMKQSELDFRRDELELRRQEKAREGEEKANRLQLEIQLENTRQTTQQQIFKMQSDASAVMQQMLTSVMPQKTPLDKYRDRKASIAAMLAAGDITANVSKQLMTKLESELLDSNLI